MNVPEPRQSVLVVDADDAAAAAALRVLRLAGYDAQQVRSGRHAREAVAAAPFDVVVPELVLPDVDGLDLCRDLRERGYRGAIMVLTRRRSELDRVASLDCGADDCVVKPFGLDELPARVRALLRRLPRSMPVIDFGDDVLTVDVAARRAFAGTEEIPLSVKEFDLLRVLNDCRGKVVARDSLMSRVWTPDWFGSTKTLDVTIGRLREKLARSGLPAQIVAVRGVGFRLEAAAGF